MLSDVLETGDLAFDTNDAGTAAFGTGIGVVPTHDGAVAEIYDALRTLRRGLVPLVDGDDAGATKIDQVRGSNAMPEFIPRWADGWTMEDAIGCLLKGDDGATLAELQGQIDRDFESIDDFAPVYDPGRPVAPRQ